MTSCRTCRCCPNMGILGAQRLTVVIFRSSSGISLGRRSRATKSGAFDISLFAMHCRIRYVRLGGVKRVHMWWRLGREEAVCMGRSPECRVGINFLGRWGTRRGRWWHGRMSIRRNGPFALVDAEVGRACLRLICSAWRGRNVPIRLWWHACGVRARRRRNWHPGIGHLFPPCPSRDWSPWDGVAIALSPR